MVWNSILFKEFQRDSFEGSEYKEAKFRLDYLARTKGFGLLTGAPGRGKTTLVRSWSTGLNPSLYKVIYTSLSTVTVNDFTEISPHPWARSHPTERPKTFTSFREEINRLALDKKKTPVIIIDEANYIKNAVLNDLKILFNFEMDSRDRAVILLVGLPQLNNTLQLSIHEPLRQRIIMNYNVDGYSKKKALLTWNGN